MDPVLIASRRDPILASRPLAQEQPVRGGPLLRPVTRATESSSNKKAGIMPAFFLSTAL
jgi:hypothetical protein